VKNKGEMKKKKKGNEGRKEIDRLNNLQILLVSMKMKK
jgi:hypothetical protein